MAMLWRDDLATGVKLIDDQHKELFDRMGKLLDACNQGKGKSEVAGMVDFLGEYIDRHFADEEELQRKSGFPTYVAHKALHDKFRADYAKLKEQFAADGATVRLVIQVNRAVVDWLVQHINRVDKGLGEYLKQKGSF